MVAPTSDTPVSYIVDADTVTDLVTGLVWQRAQSATRYTAPQARDYCANLTLAGCDAWRLPSVIELLSIVDYTVHTPSINNAAFPNTTDWDFWTSSPLTVAGYTWTVSFTTGPTFSNANGNSFPVRCVR